MGNNYRYFVDNYRLRYMNTVDEIICSDYSRIPKSLLDLGISVNAILLFAYITERLDMPKWNIGSFHDASGETYCIYTIEDMAYRLGVERRAAMKAKKELVDTGLIRAERKDYVKSAHYIYNGKTVPGKTYAPLPHWLTLGPYKAIISNKAKLIYALYLDKVMQSATKGIEDNKGIYCYLSVDEIVDMTGLSESSVIAARKELIVNQLIDTKREGRNPAKKTYLQPIGIWPEAWRKMYPYCSQFIDHYESRYGYVHEGVTEAQAREYEGAITDSLVTSTETNHPVYEEDYSYAISRFFDTELKVAEDHSLAVFAKGRGWIENAGYDIN